MFLLFSFKQIQRDGVAIVGFKQFLPPDIRQATYTEAPQQQMQMQQEAGGGVTGNGAAVSGSSPRNPSAGGASVSWTCSCGQVNTGKFCTECGSPRSGAASWTCSCGHVNSGKFCSECGKPRP